MKALFALAPLGLVFACTTELPLPDPETPAVLTPLPEAPDGPTEPEPDPTEPDPVEPDPVEPDPVEPDPVEPDPDPVGSFDGALPEIPAQAGIAYLAHYETEDLQIFRYDGDVPVEEATVAIGGYSIDSRVDPINDLLFVAHDVARTVEVFQLHRPNGPSDPLISPVSVATIAFELMPRKVRLDPYTETLYVVAAATDGNLLVEESLLLFDYSDPSAPVPKSDLGDATIPVTTSIDIDPVRKLLFLVALTTDTLHVYDLAGPALVELGGEPIFLPTLYTGDNNSSFQARNLTVDPWNARIYAARSQTILSELIAFSYPAGVPTGGARYSQAFTHTDLVMIEDGFDLDVEPADRPNLLGAHRPIPDPFTGDVFLLAEAWNGNLSTAIAVPMDGDDLAPATACDDFEGFGCFLRSHYQSNAGSYVQTDGAACFDATHRVLVMTSIDVYNPQDPGIAHLFSVGNDLSLSALLPDGGGNLRAGGLPISAACF